MLGKLIKHDWISVWKTLLLINGALLIVTLVGCISFFSPLWSSDIGYLNLLAGLILFGNILTLVISGVATTLYIAVHYYRNLFTDEGYLMHTLPVRSWQLIASKLIVAFTAQLISVVMILLCVFLLVMSASLQFAGIDEIRAVFHEFGILFTVMGDILGIQLVPLVLYTILYCIVSLVTAIMTIYGAISIGQMFQKHRVIFSVIFYFVIYSVHQAVLSIGMFIFAIPHFDSIQYTEATVVSTVPDSVASITLATPSGGAEAVSIIWQTLWLGLGSMVVVSIALFLLSKYMMTRKLNLE